jgi:hypothetical protein
MVTLAAVVMLGQICQGPGCGSGLASMLFPRRVNIAPPTTSWEPYKAQGYAYTPTAYSYATPATYTYAAPTYAYPAAPPAAPAPRVVYSTPAPAKHTAYDCEGQSWTHADARWLQAWIAGRDAVLKSSRAQGRIVMRTSARTQVETCPPGCSCTTPGDCGNDACSCTTPPAR